MAVKKRVTHYRRNPMNMVQYVLAVIIILMIMLSFIPTIYGKIFHILFLLLFIQIIISIFRLRLLNIFFEVMLVILAGIMLIPILFKNFPILDILLFILNYIFIIIAFFVAVIDMSTFKSNMIYKRVEIFTTGKSKKNPQTSKKKAIKKPKKNAKSADFEVKEKKKTQE